MRACHIILMMVSEFPNKKYYFRQSACWLLVSLAVVVNVANRQMIWFLNNPIPEEIPPDGDRAA